VLDTVALDLLQFHGDETAKFCAQFGRPYLKALRMKLDIDLALESRAYESARGILVDAWHEQQFGGTGMAFDWSLLGSALSKERLVLAGGLHPGNVADAIRQVQPWAVDVSSGVEIAPGIKSADLIRRFVDNAGRAHKGE
jgi:phosphoribosylanthranilate isomerase